MLADGRILNTGSTTRKNVVGYDLTRLFVGSEGTLTLELMDALTVEIVEQFAPSGLTSPRGALLIGQTVGESARTATETITRLCEGFGGVDAVVSMSTALLDSRRMVNPALHGSGIKVSCDVGVPISQLAPMFVGVGSIALAA